MSSDETGEPHEAVETDETHDTDETQEAGETDEPDRDVPDWDDEYIDRVSDRLMFNYDLEKDYAVRSERFDLYGAMTIHSQKEFFHPALSYGHHESDEHLFVRRADTVRVADMKRLVALGHDLADEWIEPDERHYGTDFTFGVVVPSIPDDVQEFVSGFKDRTLLKFGYYGHYEINLLVVAPEQEALAASRSADVATAFRLWETIPDEEPGLLALISRRLQI